MKTWPKERQFLRTNCSNESKSCGLHQGHFHISSSNAENKSGQEEQDGACAPAPLGHFCLKAFKVLVLECVTDTAVLKNKPSQLLRCQSTEPAHPTWHLDGVRRVRDPPPLEQLERCCPPLSHQGSSFVFARILQCKKVQWMNKQTYKTSGQEGAQGVVRLSLVQLCFKIVLFKPHIG